MEQLYYDELMECYILGYILRHNLDVSPSSYVEWGNEQGLKLYHFKKKEYLPRVKRVLGFLKGITFENLLDVGSGRGVFLFPFLEEFSWSDVTSIDILQNRVDFLENISIGGLEKLHALKADLCAQPYPDNTFDVITLLEVLEHIPDVQSAINAAVKMARKYIVVSVPSKEDDNPEHIHLLDKQTLTNYFNSLGVTKLTFDGVNGHLFMVGKL